MANNYNYAYNINSFFVSTTLLNQKSYLHFLANGLYKIFVNQHLSNINS